MCYNNAKEFTLQKTLFTEQSRSRCDRPKGADSLHFSDSTPVLFRSCFLSTGFLTEFRVCRYKLRYLAEVALQGKLEMKMDVELVPT